MPTRRCLLNGSKSPLTIVILSHEPAPEQTPVRAQELSVPETHPQQQPAQSPPAPVQESPSTPVTSPPSQPPVSAVPTLFQQAIPQQAQQQPPVQPVSQPQHSLPSSLSQSTISSQSSLQSTPATSSISPYSHQSQALPQQSLSNHQLPQNQPQIHSQQHQYVQHGLPTHLDPAQSHVQHPPSLPHASQQQNITSPSYFRQPEAPYFHTPTPPAGQAQESPYGTFGQLGQQLQHQGQGSHLGSFGGGEYGYGENQRVWSFTKESQSVPYFTVYRISTIRIPARLDSEIAMSSATTRSRVFLEHSNNRMLLQAYPPRTLSRRNNFLHRLRPEVRHNPVQAKDPSKAILPPCLTTTPIHRINTTVLHTILVTPSHSHLSSTRPSSRPVLLDRNPLPLQRRSKVPVLSNRSRPMGRVCTVSSTLPVHMTTLDTSTTHSTRTDRVLVVAFRRMTMANTSRCTVRVGKGCRALWALAKPRALRQVPRLGNALKVDHLKRCTSPTAVMSV